MNKNILTIITYPKDLFLYCFVTVLCIFYPIIHILSFLVLVIKLFCLRKTLAFVFLDQIEFVIITKKKNEIILLNIDVAPVTVTQPNIAQNDLLKNYVTDIFNS